MSFNSVEFGYFLLAIFLLYWFIVHKQLRLQNLLLLAGSFYFYGRWDIRFLFLLSFTILLDFVSGLRIHRAKSEQAARRWLYFSVVSNLGILAFFKYFNFFTASFSDFAGLFGLKSDPAVINIILPVGISFYTFHGLSYVFDIHRKKLKPTTSLIDYALFVSFFPLLVAGPIERARHLLPQIERPRQFDYGKAVDGLRQILWGLVKKVVIADSCAPFVNDIFLHSADYSGSTLLVGIFLFAFQLYGDFSGYSDIAIGTARLFGFDLLRNFAFPYFSRSVPEFWQRWHISLSTWFRDYLAIPLLAHRKGIGVKVRVTFILFLTIGLWHGANWTFIAWGLLNGLFMMPSLIWKPRRNNLQIVAHDRALPTGKELMAMLGTFSLSLLTGIFFRSQHMHQAMTYLGGIFSPSLFRSPEVFPKAELLLIALFIILEWGGRRNRYALEFFLIAYPAPVRLAFYSFAAFLIVLFWRGEQTFIYFQF